jgi:hypothetical protein
MWKGDMLKAGMDCNGFDVNVFQGNIYARNFPGSSGMIGMTFGETAKSWFVDGNVTTSGDGRTWANAYKTITEAIAAAGENDAIYIAPASYDEGAAINIATNGLKLIGPGGNTIWPSWITNSDDHHLLTISANNVIIYGLEFWQVATGNYDAIVVTGYSNQVINCSVSCTGSGRYGIDIQNDWNLIDKVTIYDCPTAGIKLDEEYNIVRNCTIDVIASGIGIDFVEATGEFNKLIGNVIRGVNDSDTGIKLAAGVAADEVTIALNSIINCATPITVGFPTPLYDTNFLGSDDDRYHSKAKTWYVDKDVTASGDGRCWMSAFKTVTEALAVADEYDTVMIHEGVYDEGAVLEITQKGLRLFGENTTFHMYGTTSLKASAADHVIIDVQADQVEIAYLSFIQNNANKIITIDHSASVYKTHIHDCHFGSAGATYAIDAGGTFDAVDTIIERCHFTVGTALVGVRMNATRSALVNCYFAIAGSGTGYVHTPNTADRPYTRVIGCKFHAEDVTNGNGIVVTNTPTAGMFYVGDCLFSYFASDNKAVSKRTGYCGLNWRDAAVLPVT